jgi:hypothetical protein
MLGCGWDPGRAWPGLVVRHQGCRRYGLVKGHALVCLGYERPRHAQWGRWRRTSPQGRWASRPTGSCMLRWRRPYGWWLVVVLFHLSQPSCPTSTRRGALCVPRQRGRWRASHRRRLGFDLPVSVGEQSARALPLPAAGLQAPAMDRAGGGGGWRWSPQGPIPEVGRCRRGGRWAARLGDHAEARTWPWWLCRSPCVVALCRKARQQGPSWGGQTRRSAGQPTCQWLCL